MPENPSVLSFEQAHELRITEERALQIGQALQNIGLQHDQYSMFALFRIVCAMMIQFGQPVITMAGQGHVIKVTCEKSNDLIIPGV